MRRTMNNIGGLGALVALIVACPMHLANAQTTPQRFVPKYVAATADNSGTILVPLPTIAIVPEGDAPISPSLAIQLTDAVDRVLTVVPDGDRFTTLTNPVQSQVQWAFIARNEPRADNAALTEQLFESLTRCLFSLEVGVEVAGLNLLLVGGTLPDDEARDDALRGGMQMRDNWRDEECQTARNELPFFEDNAEFIRAATQGMLTDKFDATIFNGQGVLDLIRSLYGLFFHPGGLWDTDRSAKLASIFTSGIENGFLSVDELDAIRDIEFASFWDALIAILTIKSTVVHSFLTTMVTSCVDSIDDLNSPFQLQHCIERGNLDLIELQLDGKIFVAAQTGGMQ